MVFGTDINIKNFFLPVDLIYLVDCYVHNFINLTGKDIEWVTENIILEDDEDIMSLSASDYINRYGTRNLNNLCTSIGLLYSDNVLTELVLRVLTDTLEPLDLLRAYTRCIDVPNKVTETVTYIPNQDLFDHLAVYEEVLFSQYYSILGDDGPHKFKTKFFANCILPPITDIYVDGEGNVCSFNQIKITPIENFKDKITNVFRATGESKMKDLVEVPSALSYGVLQNWRFNTERNVVVATSLPNRRQDADAEAMWFNTNS